MNPTNAEQAAWWYRHAYAIQQESGHCQNQAQWERLSKQYTLAKWRADQFRRANIEEGK